MGGASSASGDSSMAFGLSSNASGGHSIAIGEQSNAAVEHSVALGSHSQAGANAFDATSQLRHLKMLPVRIQRLDLRQAHLR